MSTQAFLEGSGRRVRGAKVAAAVVAAGVVVALAVMVALPAGAAFPGRTAR